MDFSFKDFDKLDTYSKKVVISVIVLMPFWYVSIYLFNNHFYVKSTELLKILFCFCLSVSYYGFILIMSLIGNSRFKELSIETVFTFVGTISVVFLSGSIGYNYYVHLPGSFILSIFISTFIVVGSFFLILRLKKRIKTKQDINRT